MTDKENKDLEREEPAEEQFQEAQPPAPPAEQPPEPVEDGFSQPPEAEPEALEPALQEPQEPITEEPAAGQAVPPPVPESPAVPWPEAPSFTPPAGQPVPPPPVWPGQPYMPPAGPMPPAAPYGPGGYPAYYGYAPQPGVQAAPAQPQAAYYGAPPAYGPYGAAYPQQPSQPAAPPKKKKPLGLKILLWLVSILAAGSLLGFGVYLAVEWNTSERFNYADRFMESIEPPYLPEDSTPGKETEPPVEPEPPAQEESEELPDVDVTPNTDGIQITPKPEGEALEPEDLYNQVVKSTVGVNVTLTRDGQTAQSRGTGIIATSDGYIITNAHVVLNSKNSRIKVTVFDGQEYDAVVVGVDRTTDLAVIKTNDYNFTPAVFGDAEELSMGEWVMALGNPGGTKYANSLTRGIVSGLNREAGQHSLGGMTYIQTDAAINPGNSGGPLVNMYGQVVGINSSKIVTENYEGMGFAIPVSQARPILNELLSGGYIKGRTRLGIMIREIDADTARYTQVPQGLQITQINSDSAFTGTEAQEGDIITALDGEPVTSLQDVSGLLTNYAPGDKVPITLYRPEDGTELTVTVTLLEDKGETQE